ncbi:hypothetical protein J4E93_010122 [Alternaria ventricosa]|uniref:uncharacterized protein n=1 Tax=Alternaria ventricosa TaxID=1187951 RepID=UPI0020C380DE|nr:uncharacterized protein J4E93_010122 [Alternaria ventricosa]KAI4638322.1 hypothetical protein J4E93_010122 [Alternaria ventricosa]
MASNNVEDFNSSADSEFHEEYHTNENVRKTSKGKTMLKICILVPLTPFIIAAFALDVGLDVGKILAESLVEGGQSVKGRIRAHQDARARKWLGEAVT